MDKVVWSQWLTKWEWILQIAKQRNWDYSELEIAPPVDAKKVEQVEKDLKITYPFEYKLILTEYSAGVNLFWQVENEKVPDEFKGVFRGGGRGYLWDFEQSRSLYESYQGWVDACFPNSNDPYGAVWHNKIPLLSVMTGDMIAFDTSVRKANCPIVFLSHDGDDFHGHKLADNFIDFIDRITNIGCVGTEDWQYEPFYDFSKMELMKAGPIVERWKQWLEK